MNLFQTKLLTSKGYKFEGTKIRDRQVGGKHYVAIAFKNGKRAEASGFTLPQAERSLVMSIVSKGDDRAAQQWKREESFLRKMARRYRERTS